MEASVAGKKIPRNDRQIAVGRGERVFPASTKA